MAKKTEKGKEELKRLKQKKFLSPHSERKKLMLEKWVIKQEEQLQEKKQWISENYNDMISKIDQELQHTKAKISSGIKGSGKKFSNASFDWSKNELNLSVGHFTNSSIHSTPRIEGDLAQLIRSKSQVAPKQKREEEVKVNTRLFEYKMPEKKEDEKVEEVKQTSKLFISENKNESNSKPQQKQVGPTTKVVEQTANVILADSRNTPRNIFAENLASISESERKSQTHIGMDCDGEEDEAESLSKMEPPHF